jgi:DNA-binding transcriptional ArsR family regulator
MDEQTAVPLVRDRFEAITGLAVDGWEYDRRHVGGLVGADARLSTGGKQFMVEYRPAATSEQLSAALRRLSTCKPGAQGLIPLLVVPYMGPTGQQLCRSEGISWLDLSGNADISAPPIRIRILGQPNQFKRPGRPSSLFSPGSSRLARTLLLDPARTCTQTDLAQSTGLSPGFLSRLLPRYEEAGFVTRTPVGRMIQFRATDPDGLLDAWCAAYRFTDHTILRGHIAARTGPELLLDLVATLTRLQQDYAATGLAAAWRWAPFASFRLVTLYLPTWPSQALLSDLGFQEGERGSNAWLVVPNDEGVFAGAATLDGVRCASALQTYLDLKGHPERAAEAAEELRRVRLSWLPTEGGAGH